MENTALTCTAYFVTLLMFWVGWRYCVNIKRNPNDATLSMWIIFAIGVDSSLAIYFTSPQHSIVKSVNNVTDSVVVTGILAMLVIKRWREEISFSKNEKWCFKIAGAALVVWALTRTSWIGVAGFQIVMLVAYEPTVKKLWRWEPKSPNPPEPAETWGVNAVAALISMGIDVMGPHPDYVAVIYPSRGFICCCVVFVLILRWKRKTALYRALQT